ncbi:dTDP-4-dehydrorhamnose 3,5-epimerase [soil metagenome]
MEIRELSVAGAFEMTPKIIGDARGAFLEWFRADRFTEVIGHRFDLVQANCSVSAAGTVRGVHFADVPPSQAKYVTCPSGALVDVVVDLRVGSPTYGEHEMVQLDDENRAAVYVGEGLGHAFMALEDRTVIQYLCSAGYSPGREHGVHPLDPDLAIDWPTVGRDGQSIEMLLSDKDAQAPTLAEASSSGLLTSYDAVKDFLSSLSD